MTSTPTMISIPQFQSTLPRGERPRLIVFGWPKSRFQSTLPRGERRTCPGDDRPARVYVFQSTLPRGERLGRFGSFFVGSIFQSTLPRGERQIVASRDLAGDPISIHAPTRGATLLFLRDFLIPTDFNPRSHEGSDQGPYHRDSRGRKFQSTLPRGERQRYQGEESEFHVISIHAPTRGATWCYIYVRSTRTYFNPRSHEGSDGRSLISFPPARSFQSTLPRGERPAYSAAKTILPPISIHAPTRGATFPYLGE